jgi:ubiquinone biosynthesis protein
LDWSLAGRLTKYDRVNTAQLIQAVIKSDLSGIRRAVKALAVCSSLDSPVQRQLFRSLVLGLIRSAGFERLSLIKRTFKLLEHLTFEGFIFSPDLMLFRKAIFTLEGVLYDLWPAFDMDNAVTRYLADLMAQEIPKRFGNLFFPLADRPENYTSLISNAELQSLAVHQYIAAVRSGARSLAGCFTGWGQMLGASFYPPFAPVPLPDESRK